MESNIQKKRIDGLLDLFLFQELKVFQDFGHCWLVCISLHKDLEKINFATEVAFVRHSAGLGQDS